MEEKNKNESKKDKKSKGNSGVVTSESISAVCALFALLALLILFTDTLVFGNIGGAISHFLLGTFGFGAYPLFIATVFVSFLVFFGKKFNVSKKAFIVFSLAVVSLMLLIHTATTFGWETEGYLDRTFNAGAELSTATATGWLGSLVVFALTSVISKVGTIIAFALCTVVFGYVLYLIVRKKGVKAEVKQEQPVTPVQPPMVQEIAQSQTGMQQNGYPQGYPVQAQYGQPYAQPMAQPVQQPVEQSPYTTPENPFNDTGAYASYPMPDVSQRPSVELPTDYRSDVRRPTYVDEEEEQRRRREFLFGSSARENFTRNLIFDKTARVNARFEEMQSRTQQTSQPASYTSGYEDSMNARGVMRTDVPTTPLEQQPTRLTEEPVSPSYDDSSRMVGFGFQTDDTTRLDTQSFVEEKPYLDDGFADTELPPLRDTQVPERETPVSSDEEYRRHDYMDLFSTENPRIFGEDSRVEQMPTEEVPPRREDGMRSDRSISSLDSRISIFDDDDEDVPQMTDRTRFADDVPSMPTSRFDAPYRASEPVQPVAPVVPVAPPAPVVPKKPRVFAPYKSAPADYFDYRDVSISSCDEDIETAKEVIISTLMDYKIADPQISSTTFGPTVTRYNVSIPRTVSPKKVIQLDQEIAMQLFAKDGVNIYANYEDCVVSIEVPNKKRQFVQLGCMLTGDQYVNAKRTSLVFAMGKDVANRKVYGDFTEMIHLLVAGTSGSGKSVLLNTMIISLINKYSPAELRMILIDPKQNEFIIYAGLPHLIVKDIITDAKKSIQALNWAIGEMHRRNKLFAEKTLAGTRVVNIDEYNAHVDSPEEKLPRIVIIIDELADLMLAAKKDVEEKIQSLTQMSRSAGIHVVVSTQRPSTDVITGVIKSNLATRIACKVPTDVDSRVILDQTGAQKLLGKGDFLYVMPGESSPIRVQSAFISSDDIQRVVDYIKLNNQPDFDEEVAKFISSGGTADMSAGAGNNAFGSEEDMTEFVNALRVFIEAGRASASLLVGKLRIGYGKAARIVDAMAELNYISQYDGAKARKVFITKEQFIEKYGSWD